MRRLCLSRDDALNAGGHNHGPRIIGASTPSRLGVGLQARVDPGMRLAEAIDDVADLLPVVAVPVSKAV